MPQLKLRKEFLPHSPCSPSNQSVFPRRSGQGGFVRWQLALGRRRAGGEAQHTPCSRPRLMLLLAFSLAAEERSSTAPGKASLKEREAFNARNILKVSMKPAGERSQLRVLSGQKRLRRRLEAALVLGDLPGGVICLESNQSRSLITGSTAAFTRSLLRAGEARIRSVQHGCSGGVRGAVRSAPVFTREAPGSCLAPTREEHFAAPLLLARIYAAKPACHSACSFLFIYLLISAIDSLGEEHAAARAEPAGSLCCSASWQRRAGAALPGPCKDPGGKGEPGEAKRGSSTDCEQIPTSAG